MVDKVLFSHNSDEWSTPDWLFDKLNSIYDFTLDACANDFNHKCERYYTIIDNGLEKSWEGETVFCNPPYSQIALWARKCYLESYVNKCTVVMLVPARTDTKWFHNYVYGKSEIIFIKGRLHFNNSKNGAPFPSMIVVYKM